MKKRRFHRKRDIFIALCMGVCLLMTSCSKNDDPIIPEKPIVTPEPEPEPPTATDVPKSITECVSTDIETLQAINKENPGANLFEGEDPSKWKAISLKWEKNEEGKYMVSEFTIPEDARISTDLLIKIGDTEQKKLLYLQSLKIKSATVKGQIIINNCPLLALVELDGLKQAKATEVTVTGNTALKQFSISGFPTMTTVHLIGKGDLDKVTLANLPSLKDEFKIQDGYNQETATLEKISAKELVLNGDLSNLDYLYLTGIGLQKIDYSNASLPSLATLTLTKNNLEGELTVDGLNKLDYLSLGNNKLTNVSVSNCAALREFDVSMNKDLTRLTLNGLSSLKIIDANTTKLSSWDLSNQTALTSVSSYKSLLTSVTLPVNAPALTKINLQDNLLPQFNYTNASIELLTLDGNQLTTLDVSAMANLDRLAVKRNRLESLTVGDNSKLTGLECDDNKLHHSKLLAIIAKFPTLKFTYAPQYVNTPGVIIDKDSRSIEIPRNGDGSGFYFYAAKKTDKGWVEASRLEASQSSNTFTFYKPGKYYVVGDSWSKLKGFTMQKPYIIGELEI